MADHPESPSAFGLEAGIEATDRWRWPRWSWWLPILLAVLVFEATSNPILGVATACLKFGLKDFRTAFWLRRTDPIRSRGRAASWFFATYGIVKTGGAALAAIVLLALTMANLGRGNNLPQLLESQVIAALLTLFACYGLGMLTACFGVLAALWKGHLVWIDARIHRACERRYWPPHFDGWEWFHNGAGVVVLGASATFLLVGMLVLMILGMTLLFKTGLNARIDPAHGPTLVVLALLAVVGIVLISIIFTKMMNTLRRRVVALSPYQCYSPEEIA